MNVKQRKGVGEQVQKKYLEVKRRQVKMDHLIRTKLRFSKDIELCCTYTVWFWHVTRQKNKQGRGLKIFTFHEILLGVKIKANWMGVTRTTRSIYAQCIQKCSLRTWMEDVSWGAWAWMKLRDETRGYELDSSGSENSSGAVLQQKNVMNFLSP